MSIELSVTQPPSILKLLAHEIRWKLLALLARSDYCVQELVAFLHQPQNLISYHLRQLRDEHVVTERRSSADARDIYYSLDFASLRTLYFATGQALHPALGEVELHSGERTTSVHQKPLRVLFLCTENSARSQMAEALLRHLSGGSVEAYSAGSHPTRLHPQAKQVLEEQGITTHELRAKSLGEFLGQDFDCIVTVCDRVRESCPTFPGDPECIHWSFADPAQVEGTAEEHLRAFEQISLQLTTRLRFLLTLFQREYRR